MSPTSYLINKLKRLKEEFKRLSFDNGIIFLHLFNTLLKRLSNDLLFLFKTCVYET